MAEVALGVLGVVPLGGLVIQSYKKAFSRLKSFRNYDNEAVRIQQELDLQWRFFKNDWKILLKLVIRTTGTGATGVTGLERDIQATLGENHDSYRYLVEKIASALNKLQAELHRVHLLEPPQTQEAGAANRLQRVQDGIRIMRKSASFSEALEELKASTSQLMKLRSQLEKLTADKQGQTERSSPPPHLRPDTKPRRISGAKGLYANEWAECRSVCRASNALYDALTDAWKCSREHEKHLLKLFIGSKKAENEVKMKLGIIYTIGHDLQPSLVQLEVRSESLQWIESLSRDEVDRPPKRPRILPTTSSNSGQDGSHDTTMVSGKQDAAPLDPKVDSPLKDLSRSEDVCLSLTCVAPSPGSGPAAAMYIGHLDGQHSEPYRHTFYSDHDRAMCRSRHEPIPVHEMLLPALRDRVSRVDKLRLARCVTLTVLKFHSTPWLGDVWQLRDLSVFFDEMEDDLSQCLDTLHLNTDLARRSRLEDSGSGSSKRVPPAARTEDEVLCNIKNRPLYSLGVALLQIDLWARLDVSDVVAVRGAAEVPSRISEKYRYLTERCLECNFGPGCPKMLADARLQRAVFRYVVGELDVLVSLAEKMDVFESTTDDEPDDF